jgi:succinate dehydrogenase / fumarate reductase, iron-sulfur subunit
MPRTTIELRIKRQDNPTARSRWEEFTLPWQPNMNVVSCLMEIRKNPVTADGKPTTPVHWEASCLEEVCGSCTMLVNGRPRQSCTALIDSLGANPVMLEPLTKFPVIRDLQVDRTPMFDALKRVKAWIPIDGSYDLGPGPRLSAGEQEVAYAFSRCMTCGCCMEVCPQYNDRSDFIGPAPLAQVRLFNSHPTGRMNAAERLKEIMGVGGLVDCGNAQNCVEVCPKEIPLTEAFGELGRQTTLQWLKQLFGK